MQPMFSEITFYRWLGKKSAVWLYILTLAWAPFPLGGAIAWASGLQEALIAVSFILWAACNEDIRLKGGLLRSITVPLALSMLVLLWGFIQCLSFSSQAWSHPIWGMTKMAIHAPSRGTISINPWASEAELVKLSSYVCASILAFRMARSSLNAHLLVDAIIVIGAAYCLYAFGLELCGMQQTALFYAVPWKSPLMSGPFMLHNSFATYSGLIVLCAVAKLFDLKITSAKRPQNWHSKINALIRLPLSKSALPLACCIFAFSCVVISASRGGFGATICGLIVAIVFQLIRKPKNNAQSWAGLLGIFSICCVLVLVVINGQILDGRLSELLAGDVASRTRLDLWAAALRMIQASPYLGLGLGSFGDAYPLYAAKVFPFVIDKAHNDYLELAAGLGIPAAIIWWLSIAWVFFNCCVGCLCRNRDHIFPLLAIGGTVLVASHSIVDFSLQIPAVALLYATLLGIGAAQSQSSRR